jgi:sugar phosphate isomerase/epimerase
VAGTQLFFFYAWQHEPDTKQLPGHGSTDFAPWLAALAAIRYRGYVNPFMHGHPEPAVMSAALAKSKEYLLERYAHAVKG